MTTTGPMPPWAPEGMRYAGLGVRIGANLLDLLWIGALNVVVALVLGVPMPKNLQLSTATAAQSPGVAASAAELIGLFLPPLLIVAFWIVKGATPGKMMCRLRIVDEVTGGRPTAWQCVGRYVVGVFAIAVLVGYVWIGIDPRAQGWHDKLVRTLVVRRP